MTAASSPIANAERAEVLDALRGFALLGIVITHMPDFSGYSFLSPADRQALDRFGLDAQLATVAEFVIRGKFLSLFALLFGIGFAVQMDSAGRRGANFNRHFIRRLAALLAIGLAHACVWYGDILKDYALLGMLLLLTARWSVASLVRATAIALVLRMVWPAIVWASGFALLWMRGWQRVLSAFAPAGRMALTTYVTQTLIGVFLFYGVGLKLGNTIGFAEATALAIAIFAVQCVASRIWLQTFRFGPLEWIWRRATYGTPVAMLH